MTEEVAIIVGGIGTVVTGLGGWAAARYKYGHLDKDRTTAQLNKANEWIERLYDRQDELEELLADIRVELTECHADKKLLQYQLDLALGRNVEGDSRSSAEDIEENSSPE